MTRRYIGQAPPLTVVPGAIAPVPGGAAPRRVIVRPRGVHPGASSSPARSSAPEHWTDYPRTASDVRDAIRVTRAWAGRYRVPGRLLLWGSSVANAGLRDATTQMRRFVQNTGDEAFRMLAEGRVDEAAHQMRALLNYIGRVQSVTRAAETREGFLEGLVQSMQDFRRDIAQAVERAGSDVAHAVAPIGAGLLVLVVLLLFAYVGRR